MMILVFNLNRYLENNARLYSQYRQYHHEMPHYLHDRPTSLVDHCLERLVSAAEIEKECIQVTDEERGSFKVKGQDPNTPGCWYNVSFGDDKTMPHCECADWEKNRLPCKHFLAVFRHSKGWGFDKLPAHYRESPFLTLDNDVVFCKEPLPKNETSGKMETEHGTIPEKGQATHSSVDENLSDLPGRQKLCRTWNTKCREAIKQLTSLTHIVDDTESLKQVHALLRESIEVLNKAALKDDGLVLENPVKLKLKPKPNSTASKTGKTNTLKEIPHAKSKHPFSGRHGERAEIMKRTFKVNVDVTAGEHVPKRPKKSLTDSGIETEIVSMDLDPSTTDDTEIVLESTNDCSPGIDPATTATSEGSMANASVCPEGDILEEKKKEEKEVHEKDKSVASGCSEKLDMPAMKKKTNQNTGAHTFTVIDDDSPDPPIWLTIHNSCPDDPASQLTLYKESKASIVKKTYWLHDSEIHAGQVLLKTEFPLIDGLNDPAIRGPLVVPAMSEFVQIVNVGSHWVCLSTLSCIPGVVKVFDSLYRKPNAITIEHACRMLLHTGEEVTFVNEKVQKQLGGSDCGLFALAFATDLCNGLNPTDQSYDQGMMRRHYVDCLESGKMTCFPNTSRRVPYHLDTQKTKVSIYCVCRLPYDKKEYVQCCRCCGWYHTNCVAIPEWAINSKRKWRCQKCKDCATLKPRNFLVL